MSEFTDLQERARRLLGYVSLTEVRLFGLSARHCNFADGDRESHLGDLSIRLEATAQGGTGLAYVLVVQTQLLEPVEGDDERVLADLEVAYGALYSLDEAADGATEEETRAFGFAVATMTVWPFIRAEIASTLTSMHFDVTGGLIPTITQRELAEAAAAAEVLDEEQHPLASA